MLKIEGKERERGGGREKTKKKFSIVVRMMKSRTCSISLQHLSRKCVEKIVFARGAEFRFNIRGFTRFEKFAFANK